VCFLRIQRGGANTVSVGGGDNGSSLHVYMVFRYKKNGELVLRRAVVSQRVEAAACVS